MLLIQKELLLVENLLDGILYRLGLFQAHPGPLGFGLVLKRCFNKVSDIEVVDFFIGVVIECLVWLQRVRTRADLVVFFGEAVLFHEIVHLFLILDWIVQNV